MSNNLPSFVVSEQDSNATPPLLIVDKKGLIGSLLAKRMQHEFLTVLVSGRQLEVHQNIIYIPYRKKIPAIPDNAYSHMFIVYNGEQEVLDMLPSFIKKANATGARVLFITHLLQSSKKLFDYLDQHVFHHVQILVFGETFDNHIREANEVNFFIHQARVYGRIAVPNSGVGKLYPILLDDVIDAAIVTAFGDRPYKRLLLFPHHPITEVSVARMMQKIDPDLQVDYIKQKIQQNDFYLPHGGVYFFSNYNLEEKLRKIDLSRKMTKEVVDQKKIKLVLPRRRQPYPYWLLPVSLAAVILVPLFSAVVLLAVGAWMLTTSIDKAERADFTTAKSYASFAHQAFSSVEAIGSLYILPGSLGEKKEQLLRDVRVGKELAAIEKDTLEGLAMLRAVYEQKSTDPKTDFMEATATLKNTLLTLQKMRAEERLPKKALKKMDELQATIGMFENVVDALPVLLGFEGKKRYLILFQNNMELRPGGGFIGSYAVLGVENGKLDKLQVHDVYDADGQMKAHVEPPYGLRRYLGASHWFLRDSNFDPDFVKNAQEATRFLKLETDEKVDGVIAIDTDFLKKILSVVGSVKVVDYNEEVTAENFYMLTQTHAEKDFFPGSTQKKDFLRALTNSLLTELSKGEKISYPKLLSKVVESVKEKHVLLWSADPGIQNIFTVNNLSSSLWDGRASEENGLLDSFGIVDANVGTNKANYYVRRSLRQDVVIGEGGAYEATASVSYENTSAKDSIYGGNYKNYVRFLLPRNSKLEKVTIDGKELPVVSAITDPEYFTKRGFVPPSGLEVDRAERKGKDVVGFLVTVPALTTKTVAITYSLAAPINTLESHFVYDLKVFKQPGTGDDPYSLVVSYPPTFKLVKSDDKGRDLGGKYVYSQNVSEDKNIRLEFSKK